MLFKKKQLSVEAKIKVATRKKKAQMIGMYVIGIAGGIGWSVVWYEGKSITQTILEGDKMTFVNETHALTLIEPESVEEKWNSSVFTSYSAGDGYTPSTTMASGKKVYVGAIACPRDIKIGTIIEVQGIGTFTCEDRKALDHDGEFDIYSSTIKEAKQFGIKELNWRIWNQ